MVVSKVIPTKLFHNCDLCTVNSIILFKQSNKQKFCINHQTFVSWTNKKLK